MYVEVEYPDFDFMGDVRAAYDALDGVRFEDALGVSSRRMRRELLFDFVSSQLDGDGTATGCILGQARPLNRHALIAAAILDRFGPEVRGIVCDGDRRDVAAVRGLSPGMAALAGLLSEKLGYPGPVAAGLATYVFALFARTPREQFCDDASGGGELAGAA